MSRLKALAIVVLLLSYGAVGARQPAVRVDVTLPASVRAIADAVGLPSADPSTLVLEITRLVYNAPNLDTARVQQLRSALRDVMFSKGAQTEDTVPLPLDPSIWRDTLLPNSLPDNLLVAAIVAERRAALLYHGLFALDDETLAWLGPDRETLLELREHPGAFAAFGRSIRVRGGALMVPGGEAAEPLWEAIVGAPTSKTAPFVRRLFKGDGRTAFFYDTIAHLDPARQRFALGLHLPESAREDRFVSLFDLFLGSSPEWRPEAYPFARPQLDPGIVLATIRVNEKGEPVGPMSRRLWDRVFRGDETIDVAFTPMEANDLPADGPGPGADAVDLAARIARVPYTIGRRRFETMLFAQRVFPGEPGSAAVGTALRGFVAYPALMLTLERIGIENPRVFAKAAQQAAALDSMASDSGMRAAMLEFQGTLGIIERIHRTGALNTPTWTALVSGLVSLDLSRDRGYEGRIGQWIRANLLGALPAAQQDATDPMEEAMLAAIAGVGSARRAAPAIDWEGARYRADPAAAELIRLHRVREHQGGPSLDAAVRDNAHLDEALASILYATYLGDPSGSSVTSGNVALRHDLGIATVSKNVRPGTPWRLPAEDFSGRSGWHVRGSLLGLDAALGRLALRRIDETAMPPQPKLDAHEVAAVNVTASLLNPFAMTDAARDEIVAALGRGRARAAALGGDRADLEKAARDAGLGEWRREALAWTIAATPDKVLDAFSLVELFWLGTPRPAAARSLDAWGAAMLPLTGCLCLEMPAPKPWEDMVGRRASGIITTRGVDVALRVAETLAALKLPASLAPAVLRFALQDVADRAQPGYADDWQEFGRAARLLGNDRLADYVAALTANGPLIPVESDR
jgi:hypothetical protein